MEKISLYKIFKFQQYRKGIYYGFLTVTQTSKENAYSAVYSHFGGKRNAKKHGISISFYSETEIVHKVGDYLEFVGRGSSGKSFSDTDYNDFIKGKKYKIQKSGSEIYVTSETGAQTKINPILFKP